MTFVHDATFKNSARCALGGTRGIPSITGPDFSANKNNPICANAAEFESPCRSPPFINSLPRRRGFFRVPSSPENYRFSRRALGKRTPQSTDRKTEAGRDEIRAGPLICREKPRIRRKIRFSAGQRPISESTGGAGVRARESRRPSVLSSPRALSYFPDSITRATTRAPHYGDAAPGRSSLSRAMPHARATMPFKRINLFRTNFAGFHLHRFQGASTGSSLTPREREREAFRKQVSSCASYPARCVRPTR